jgi:hypothetical protein
LKVQDGNISKAKELWRFIDRIQEKQDEEDEATLLNYSRKENRDLNLLVQSLSNNQLMNMQRETITKGIWETLAKHHIDKLLANKIFLTRVSFNNVIFMLDSKSFFNFLNFLYERSSLHGVYNQI